MSAEIPDAAVDIYVTESAVYMQPHRRSFDGEMFIDDIAIVQEGSLEPLVVGANALRALDDSFNNGLPVALDQPPEAKTAQSTERLYEQMRVSDMQHLVQVARLVRLVRYGHEVDVAPTDAYDDSRSSMVGYAIRERDVKPLEHPHAGAFGEAILAAFNRCTRNAVLFEED